MRKEQSTNSENIRKIIALCPLSYTQTVIGGRWKPLILDRLMHGIQRYSEIRKSIPPITERMLTMQLKELERDGLIARAEYGKVPMRVEYTLTEKGASLKTVLTAMYHWGSEFNTTLAAT
ncbi:helix-turn-helix transcriptional regulator [Chitinophaga sp. Mgbs1]|uniref:Helix-turn-helix transcriptional regulator n=1 Tax=Chitinophaga solisilvae TaxID=1233460 RepID=A0A433WH53_9BACT|nr:helix-turn-helix transcriptional regulator [Chitinophaga solisilvae]